MPIGRREWPNTAKENRDRAGEETMIAIAMLEPVCHETTRYSEIDRAKREHRALNSLYKIALILKDSGAPINIS